MQVDGHCRVTNISGSDVYGTIPNPVTPFLYPESGRFGSAFLKGTGYLPIALTPAGRLTFQRYIRQMKVRVVRLGGGVWRTFGGQTVSLVGMDLAIGRQS